jgi:hypothetical protein
MKGKTSEKVSKRQVLPLEETKPERITLMERLEEKLKNTPQMRPHHNCVFLSPDKSQSERGDT